MANKKNAQASETALENAVKKIVQTLSDKERRQDQIIPLTREIIRDCALGIKAVHAGDLKETERKIDEIEGKLVKLHSLDEKLENVSQQCYQEYAEIKCLHAILTREPIPTYEEIGINLIPWLSGLADCVGELRRAVQLALSEGDAKKAKYYFEKMNAIYDNLMVIKFSSSLVGGLKHKQDVIRGQIEQARSEMLRSA
ncbi:TPA: hypothetical protein HA318_00830 [Candidatus Micrarchaeota archaeon]|nr:MAG: hypothetical protein AUJ65_03700 [Candidatus Micrarchaeota archaeon CG1_02_51_15]HII38532.1 hypothetical protein [Candidatus Micrarchaeota archaeon]